MNRKILRIIPSILIMTGLFALSALPGRDPLLNSVFFLSDKIEHLIAYFVFGISVCIWTHSQKWFAKPLRYAVRVLLVCTLFSVSDEYHQSFVPERSGNDLGDLIANFIGSFFSPIAYLIVLKLRIRFFSAAPRREPEP